LREGRGGEGRGGRVVRFLLKREKISIDIDFDHEKFDLRSNRYYSIKGVPLRVLFSILIV